MADRSEGYGQARAVACVFRDDSEVKLLIFDHPHEGAQITKGRIDEGETPREAAIRELTEESGLELEPSRFLSHVERAFDRLASTPEQMFGGTEAAK